MDWAGTHGPHPCAVDCSRSPWRFDFETRTESTTFLMSTASNSIGRGGPAVFATFLGKFRVTEAEAGLDAVTRASMLAAMAFTEDRLHLPTCYQNWVTLSVRLNGSPTPAIMSKISHRSMHVVPHYDMDQLRGLNEGDTAELAQSRVSPGQAAPVRGHNAGPPGDRSGERPPHRQEEPARQGHGETGRSSAMTRASPRTTAARRGQRRHCRSRSNTKRLQQRHHREAPRTTQQHRPSTTTSRNNNSTSSRSKLTSPGHVRARPMDLITRMHSRLTSISILYVILRCIPRQAHRDRQHLGRAVSGQAIKTARYMQ